MGIKRRDFLKFATLVGASSAFGADTFKKKKNKKNITAKKAPLPPKKSPRVVVVGGGWSGLSVAKHVKLFAKDAEVILIEQKDIFISCPVSNLWLFDKVETDFIIHDYLKAANNFGYTYFHASVYDVDKENFIVYTTNGYIEYDYLVLAVGIDYDYSFWVGEDKELEQKLYKLYPPAFKPGSEHWRLKEKIHNFKGGTFVITVPGGNYRCLPAPYERACLIADFFKYKGLKAKVLILDENNDIRIKEHGFSTAFKALYKDYIEWEPNSIIKKIDIENKKVYTEFEEYEFEDAIFYPRVRGAKILEDIGIAKDSVYNRLEANIDPISYEVIGYPNIYVCGDARPMGFSKSGNTAYTEAQHVASLIAAKINKQSQPKWKSPITLCISAVSLYPERGIFIHSEYAFNKKTKRFEFATPVTDEIWQGEEGIRNAKSIYDWASSMYHGMFGG